MPLSKGHKNKQKQWRREAEFSNAAMEKKHTGRSLKAVSGQERPSASPIIAGLFERAGIRMPRAEAFRQAYQSMLAGNVAGEIAAPEANQEGATA